MHIYRQGRPSHANAYLYIHRMDYTTRRTTAWSFNYGILLRPTGWHGNFKAALRFFLFFLLFVFLFTMFSSLLGSCFKPFYTHTQYTKTIQILSFILYRAHTTQGLIFYGIYFSFTLKYEKLICTMLLLIICVELSGIKNNGVVIWFSLRKFFFLGVIFVQKYCQFNENNIFNIVHNIWPILKG